MNSDYKTTDIVLAAYLKLNNCALVNIEKNMQQGTFVFVNVPVDYIKTYQLGNAIVEPRMFNNMIKHLSNSVRTI
jgi:hypothetical protein